MTNIFIVRKIFDTGYDPVYSIDLAAFSTLELAEEYKSKLKSESDLHRKIWNQYNSLVGDYVRSNPPVKNMPPRPKQKNFTDGKEYGKAVKEYNVLYKDRLEYKTNYESNKLRAKETAACSASEGSMMWQEIEVLDSSLCDFDVKEVQLLA